MRFGITYMGRGYEDVEGFQGYRFNFGGLYLEQGDNMCTAIRGHPQQDFGCKDAGGVWGEVLVARMDKRFCLWRGPEQALAHVLCVCVCC